MVEIVEIEDGVDQGEAEEEEMMRVHRHKDLVLRGEGGSHLSLRIQESPHGRA